MSETKLGSIINGSAERDAIHVAIAPIIAAETLEPGEHVGLLPNGCAASHVQHIGVVDPFLKKEVMRGQKFWLILYPQTITNLRHDWKHPSFAEPSSVSATGEQSESEQYLRRFAEQVGITFEKLIEASTRFQSDYETLDHPTDQYEWDIPEEFWHHWAKFTGKITNSSETFFTCCP